MHAPSCAISTCGQPMVVSAWVLPSHPQKSTGFSTKALAHPRHCQGAPQPWLMHVSPSCGHPEVRQSRCGVGLGGAFESFVTDSAPPHAESAAPNVHATKSARTVSACMKVRA